MSKERIISALKGLGLSNIDTRVYVFLAKHGPHKIGETAEALDIAERKIRVSFRDLQSMGIIKASVEYPLEFMVMPFKEVIDLLIEVKKEQAKAMQESRKELISSWRSIIRKGKEKS